MISPEIERVRRNTVSSVNEKIDHDIAESIQQSVKLSEGALTARLDELDREWDIERLLETNASVLALVGLALAVAANRRWAALTAGVLGFLFLHGTQGWCPPLPVMRRMGVRTRSEIERERFALKFLRGDFDSIRGPDGRLNLPRLVYALEL